MTKRESVYRDTHLSDEEFTGVVITSTRRNAVVILENDSLVKCSLVGSIVKVLVGDTVTGRFVADIGSGSTDNQLRRGLIQKQLDRKNCLYRTNEFKTKELCANLDLLLIVSAGGSLTNYLFIDTLLVSALYNEINCILVVNKSDLRNTDEVFSLYDSLGISTKLVSAKNGYNLEYLSNVISEPKNSLVALTGISGVGKSSLINRVVPGAQQTVSALSRKTGQGQQTTTQAYAFPFYPDDRGRILIVDTPGVQNFGLGDIEKNDLKNHFIEIREIGSKCKYRGCLHVEEYGCEVLEAVKAQRIALSRYRSYVSILSDLERINRSRF